MTRRAGFVQLPVATAGYRTDCVSSQAVPACESALSLRMISWTRCASRAATSWLYERFLTAAPTAGLILVAAAGGWLSRLPLSSLLW